MARVFIGVPTYKRPVMVRQTIESLLAQSFDDFRVVVSDNASGEETAATIAAFVSELADPRISFVVQSVNGGEYGQGRFFLRESAGSDYFMILHDDDVLLPQGLAQGVERLEKTPEAAFFVANAYGMNEAGQRDERLTKKHLRDQQRIGAREGLYEVLSSHVLGGFAPISGTLFRREALIASGFVDDELSGNFPFEANVFLRQGEAGARAWFSTAELLGVRFHANALRVTNLLNDPDVVGNCIRLWGSRRFTGALERRRRVLVSRYRRAEMLLSLQSGDYQRARTALFDALRDNPSSLRAWAWTPFVVAGPRVAQAAVSFGMRL